MRLDPKIAEAVARTLGESVPHPESEAFRALLLRLDRDDPALAERLRSGLIFSQGGDLETQARREGQRERRRRGLFRLLFSRYDDLDNAWHPSKAKLLAFFSVVGLGGMGALFFGAPLLRGEAAPDAGSVASALLPDEAEAEAVTPAQNPDPFGGVPESVALDERARRSLAGAVPLPTSQQTRPGTATPAEDGAAPSASAPAEGAADEPVPEQPSATATPVAEGAATPYNDPLLPSTADEEDLGLGVYTGSVPGEPEPGLRVYGGAPLAGRPAAAGDPFASPQGGAADGPVGLAAYRRAEPDGPPGDLAVYRPDAAPAGKLSVFRRTRPAPTEARYVSAANVPGAPAASLAPTGQAGPDPYAVGESLRAALQVGVVAAPSTPLPVLARADDGSVWQGTATLLPTGRVELQFTGVNVGGGFYAVSAVGQADDGFLGLPATLSEATPALASDLARGALRGVSEYVQALGAETEVRVEGSVPVISRNAPPLEASVAGSVARLFTPPEGDGQQALVRLARVAAGTPVRVVVLAAGGLAAP